LPNLYNYTFNEVTGTYNFTTKNDIEYKVVFIIDETLDSVSENPIENVYQVIIEKVSDAIEPLDSAVGRTIDDIIKSFFENAQNSLIYICSEVEEKAEIRFNVFPSQIGPFELAVIVGIGFTVIIADPVKLAEQLEAPELVTFTIAYVVFAVNTVEVTEALPEPFNTIV
jgi:hypothetical protein